MMNTKLKPVALALTALFALAACKQEVKANNSEASASAATSAASAPMPSDLDSEAKQFSYAIGAEIGRSLQQMKTDGVEVDQAILSQAIEDSLNGKSKLTEAQVGEIISKAAEKNAQKAMEKQKEAAKVNLEKGEAFLKENATKAGVKTTASGLQYQVKKEGSGAKPKATDLVTVEYTGKLIDGTEFDSSKGTPVTFPLNQVIPGWTEGVQLMTPGSEYTFYIPAKLAYGENSPSPNIGPNSVLVFDVKLIKAEPNKNQ